MQHQIEAARVKIAGTTISISIQPPSAAAADALKTGTSIDPRTDRRIEESVAKADAVPFDSQEH